MNVARRSALVLSLALSMASVTIARTRNDWSAVKEPGDTAVSFSANSVPDTPAKAAPMPNARR